ncbi:hypothetical protein TREMEDRAFT_59238 [Tremella mesenterica DSM 1558]|uniref:uncharacterized protein n=1 Tax=Tremella mesenterica (strain ATCC 24925 / CBS 8224 / DSM 1558 / NBRC 9311 / NRRL Y-6157 / RJB 2259-6 / UBC 559-6) TaxID=578456 RepID=UPI0003F4A4B0|nr:uncharacterized protein TREMEDRAFT_59238 [Tremella mesenterica DSM 1558]EIW73077.1 hypothetical protein TREMEDRAFT_59238 [Tremella mesenterica DSM 1558]
MSMSKSISGDVIVEVITTSEQMSQAMEIRYKVFIEEQGYPACIEIGDPEDPISTHFLMSKDGKEIGTARITPQGKLGRVAILKSYRGQGLAKPLLNAVHEWVRSKGGKIVYCDSQAADPATGGVDARGVYLKLGYRPVGDLYIKENKDATGFRVVMPGARA